ncbi:hypothetical protein TNCT_30491 [Trichonephila clavata]|uniref:DDE-1 domain-containing protein n=1 Tax=Trichonephila clavata TaxID=2740835 RepID=A0A8X6GIZ4_TRICU|nr:hypothetical protein TNCT_30491 [Trichonephila clavata]
MLMKQAYLEKNAKQTFLYRTEKCAPGFKAAKGRSTLLLGGNVSRDFILKPLLVYHSKNSRVMKRIYKSTLPVIWESNKKKIMDNYTNFPELVP